MYAIRDNRLAEYDASRPARSPDTAAAPRPPTRPEEDTVVAPEDAALVRRYVAAVYNRRAAAAEAAALVGPSFVVRHPAAGVVLRGADGLLWLLARCRTRYPDLHLTIDALDAALPGAQTRQVGARVTLTGTAAGDGTGLWPAGRRLQQTGIALYDLVDGRVVRDTVAEDLLGMFHRFGIALAPPAAPAAPNGAEAGG